MQIDYVVPSLPLRDDLSVIGHVRGLGAGACPVLPAMLPNLHVWIRGEGRYRLGGAVRPSPRVALIGPTSAAVPLEITSDMELLCAGFLPGGWMGHVGLPCGEVADDVVDAGLVWGAGPVDELWQRLSEARTLSARGAIVEAFLRARSLCPARPDHRYAEAVRCWLEGPGPLRLDRLTAAAGLSARQVGRVTLNLYGIGPKGLAMKYRALRAASLLAVQGLSGADLALTDYADQSHQIRDFKRFLGFSPGVFLKATEAAGRTTLQGRHRAGAASLTALLS